MRYNSGLVLSGGSVRGVGHIGLLKRLEEIGFTTDVIAGTSAGAIVGAMYAAGISSDDMISFFKSTPLFKYNSINPLRAGIFNLEKYTGIFKDLLPETFEELKIPLIICATNLHTGDAEYFNSGPLIRPMLASCGIPFVFSPMKIGEFTYVDGGIQDNFPIEAIRDQTKFVIGSSVNNPGRTEASKVNSLFRVTERSFRLMIHANIKHKLKMADLLLEFPLQNFGYFDTKKIIDIYELSYEYSKQNVNEEILIEHIGV